jgi:hypothetical protein
VSSAVVAAVAVSVAVRCRRVGRPIAGRRCLWAQAFPTQGSLMGRSVVLSQQLGCGRGVAQPTCVRLGCGSRTLFNPKVTHMAYLA